MKKLLIALASAAVVSGAHAQFFSDNFNRPDAATLGPNWSVVGAGSATRTIGNQAGNVTTANNLSLVNTANYSAAYTFGSVSVDAFHDGGAGLGYVALALGHNGSTVTGNGLFVKVQGSGAAGFSSIGFYSGVNGTTTTFWSDPPIFFTANSAFTSARLTVWASSATAINLGIDTDFNGSFEQQYTRNINNTMTLGTQVGLGVYGVTAKADNFSAGVVPEPGTMAAIGLGIAALVRRRRARG